MNSGCDFFADGLVEHAAGLLDAERAERLEAHVASCADCADTLRVLTALRSEPLDVPPDLEARIRTAVRDVAAADGPGRQPVPDVATGATPRPVIPGHRRWAAWRPWTLPLATAAAMAALWIGVGMPGVPTSEPVVVAADDYLPYGSWPADGLIVAGDAVWSDLSIAELEHLLQELES